MNARKAASSPACAMACRMKLPLLASSGITWFPTPCSDKCSTCPTLSIAVWLVLLSPFPMPLPAEALALSPAAASAWPLEV